MSNYSIISHWYQLNRITYQVIREYKTDKIDRIFVLRDQKGNLIELSQNEFVLKIRPSGPSQIMKYYE